MMPDPLYDVSVVGGGLAGLTAAVLLAKQGHRVILFEKETYPFHKVCGEYISMESWNFLVEKMGVPLQDLNVSHIDKLLVTSPRGKSVAAHLDSGGFGISRFLLDDTIKRLAIAAGVTVMDDCKIDAISFSENKFVVETTKGVFHSRICCGSWGKRSNIDIKWKRPFTQHPRSGTANYVGIKYHIRGNFPDDVIALHNFKHGYCGLSKIEDDLFCLCYFADADILKKGKHAIADAEELILSQNPYLRDILQHAEKINQVPYTISQVSLERKKTVENHVFMMGDAAGMISPLCGNGMSMAMHSAELASVEINAFLIGDITRNTAEKNYARRRLKVFGKRLAAGRFIQRLFGKEWLTTVAISLMKKRPIFLRKVIALTHGKPF